MFSHGIELYVSLLTLFIYQKAAINEFTTRTHKFKRLFCTKKSNLKAGFKEICTNLNDIQIWYGEFNNIYI